MRIGGNRSIWPCFKQEQDVVKLWWFEAKLILIILNSLSCLIVFSLSHALIVLIFWQIWKTSKIQVGRRWLWRMAVEIFEKSKPNSSRKPPYFPSTIVKEGRAKYTTSFAKGPINQAKTHISTHKLISTAYNHQLMHLSMFLKFPSMIMGHNNYLKDALELSTSKRW